MCYAKLVLPLRLDVLLANRILSSDDTKRYGAFNDIIPVSHWNPVSASQDVTVSVKGDVLMLLSESYKTDPRGGGMHLPAGGKTVGRHNIQYQIVIRIHKQCFVKLWETQISCHGASGQVSLKPPRPQAPWDGGGLIKGHIC